MSTLRVPIVAIDDVQPHGNAERLEVATVAGWQCVVGKGQFKAGDAAVYIPIDACLPPDLEALIFAGAKVKLDGGRVRTIKLRGVVSQGLLVDFSKLPEPFCRGSGIVGRDVAADLGITKYEPPEPRFDGANLAGKKAGAPVRANPNFNRYTDIENSKWHPRLFEPGETVVATEKIHGTNFRAGWLPRKPQNLWERITAFLGLMPKYEFCYGSHNQQLQNQNRLGNVYEQACIEYCLKTKICPGEAFYGEIYGAGVQKYYSYGCGPDERRLVIFDISRDGEFLNQDEVAKICADRMLPMAPTLYRGPYDPQVLASVVGGPSVLCPEQKVREGFVLRPVVERHDHGRTILKFINPEYLLKHDNTDNH